MKKRLGFVSNSSSSSFCILGVSKGSIRTKLTESEDDSFDDTFDGLDYNYGLITESGICDYDDDFIGIDPSSIDENKTLKEVKEELAAKINKLFKSTITSKDIKFYYDGGYEG